MSPCMYCYERYICKKDCPISSGCGDCGSYMSFEETYTYRFNPDHPDFSPPYCAETCNVHPCCGSDICGDHREWCVYEDKLKLEIKKNLQNIIHHEFIGNRCKLCNCTKGIYEYCIDDFLKTLNKKKVEKEKEIDEIPKKIEELQQKLKNLPKEIDDIDINIKKIEKIDSEVLFKNLKDSEYREIAKHCSDY